MPSMDAGEARTRLREIENELLPLLRKAYPDWNITDNGSLIQAVTTTDSGETVLVTAAYAPDLWVRLETRDTVVVVHTPTP